MRRKKLLFIAVLLVVIAAIGALVFMKSKPHEATIYEDAEGWVYNCSQPILVKNQGVTYQNGNPSPTPINSADAAKHCRRIGKE